VTLSIYNQKSDKYTNVDLRYLNKDIISIELSAVKGEGIRYEKEHNIPLDIKLKRLE
jgi:hypothetical protein